MQALRHAMDNGSVDIVGAKMGRAAARDNGSVELEATEELYNHIYHRKYNEKFQGL